MDTKRWTSLNSIIDQALELDPEERVPFLKNIDGVSDDMRNEALSFLQSIHKSDTFWDDLIESSSELIDQIDEGELADGKTAQSPLPDQIGPYKVIKKLASGGMGNVYLAERTDGHLQITVALKLLRHECVDSHHIHQFNIERNVLAKLNHPNIARIYDGGITENGRPYLVMEYVEGESVTEYCQSHSCSIQKKLMLFEQICEGVNFAHSNLVVHRDLKPDNIFISSDGSCKILDFGIAKIIQPEDSGSHLKGENSHLKPFSICHAAPEQLSGGDIRTATDVYALGLLLYELITGSLPYDLSKTSPTKARKVIQNSNLPIPSSKAKDKTTAKNLRGDLDEIMVKALQKNPVDRYQSAGELLSDLRNFRNGLPLSFKRDQKGYKLRKFTARNRGVLLSIATLLIAVSGLTIYYISTIQQERQKAIAEEQQASFIAGFMVDLFDASDPINNVNDTLDVYDILNSGRDKLDRWNGSELSKADIMISLGNAYKKIGDYDQSLSLLEDAYQIYESSVGDSLSEQMLNPVIELASLHKEERNFNYAAHYYDRSLTILNDQLKNRPETAATIYSDYGGTLTELGNPQLAIIYLEKALTIIEEESLSNSRVRTVQTSLAQAYRSNQEYQKSEELYKAVLATLPVEGPVTIEESIIHNNLGYLLKVQDKLDEAADHYNRSLEINRNVYGFDHPYTTMVMNNLSALHAQAGRYSETLNIRLDLLDIYREKYGDSHWRTGSAYESLGIVNLQSGHLEEAPDYFKEAISIYKKALGEDHIWTERAILYYSLCRFKTDEENKAKELFRETVALLKEKRLTFSRYDVDLLNNLIKNFESYQSISNTSDFALLADLM